jgi:hypothetical protein
MSGVHKADSRPSINMARRFTNQYDDLPLLMQADVGPHYSGHAASASQAGSPSCGFLK